MNEDEIVSGDDHADLIGRLGEFSAAPMNPGVAARCLDRVRHGRTPRAPRFRVKALVAATVGAFVVGGVGLAAADVLPAPVQDVAHTTLDRVGVHVPPGHVRYNDPVACPGGPYQNHGAYVRAHKSDPAAGKSPCGKPTQSVNPSGTTKTEDANDAAPGRAGHGPPPWAHNKNKKTKNKNNAPHAASDKKTEPPDEKSASTSTTSTSRP
jgi:hypothetical protein